MTSIIQRITQQVANLKHANKIPMLILVSDTIDPLLRDEIRQQFKREVPNEGDFTFMNLPVFKISIKIQNFVNVVQNISE